MIAAAPRLRDIAWIAFFGAVCALWAVLFVLVRNDPAAGAAGMRAEHDDDGGVGEGEGGVDGVVKQRFAAVGKQLFRRAHARRFTCGEDDDTGAHVMVLDGSSAGS